MHVQMHVCRGLCICANVHACMHAHSCMCACVCEHVCMHAYVHVCIYMGVHACVSAHGVVCMCMLCLCMCMCLTMSVSVVCLFGKKTWCVSVCAHTTWGGEFSLNLGVCGSLRGSICMLRTTPLVVVALQRGPLPLQLHDSTELVGPD